MALLEVGAPLSVKGTTRVFYRTAVMSLLATMPIAIMGCGDANNAAKRQHAVVDGSIDTSYRGPADEVLSDDQRRRLRERGTLQR